MPGVEDAEQHVEQARHANGEDGEQHGHAEGERLDAEHPGMEATSQAEVDLANTMVEALLHHCGNTSESISQLLEWGTAEISHFVEYEGLGFKFRTDLKTSRKIVDWKTISSKDLHEETITSQINKMNYGFSAAFYQFFNHLATGEIGRASCRERVLRLV